MPRSRPWDLLSSPCRALPNALCSIFSACGWSISCNGICLPPHTTPFDAFFASTYCLQKSSSLLVLVLHSLAIPPPDNENWLRFPTPHEPPPFSAGLGCDLRHHSSVLHCSNFRLLVCPLTALGDKMFVGRHLQSLPLRAMRFDVLDLHQCACLVNSVQFLPDQEPQVGVLCYWAKVFQFSSPQPNNDSFIVNMYLRRTNDIPEETQEVNLSLSMVRCTSSSASRPHALVPFPHHDQAAPLTIHVHLTCPKLPTESHRW